MKISELIKLLEEEKKLSGDIRVLVNDGKSLTQSDISELSAHTILSATEGEQVFYIEINR